MQSYWIKGDIHVHSHCCLDGYLPVEEIVARSRPYCDFMAISGHALNSRNWGIEQYQEILTARKKWPDMPIFHLSEQEFPIPRHVMFLTEPANREFELQRDLTAKFDCTTGIKGIDQAVAELQYVEQNYGADCVMIYNHPNAPDVPFADLLTLAEASPIFRIIACVDRGERKAPQTWEVGAEWDQLLNKGHKIFTRFGSDFHRHFQDGGRDYYPGEFVQDQLLVKENSYKEIVAAYREGRFFSAMTGMLENPVLQIGKCQNNKQEINLSLTALMPLERIDIIGNGHVLRSFAGIEGNFNFSGCLPRCRYYRVRGQAKPRPRSYSDGEYQPVFILNPVFPEK